MIRHSLRHSRPLKPILLLLLILILYLTYATFDTAISQPKQIQPQLLNATIPKHTRTIDGIEIHTYPNAHIHCNHQKPLIAINLLVKNGNSWSFHPDARSFKDFVKMITGFTYPEQCMRLNVLVSDPLEFKRIIKFVDNGITETLFGVNLVHINDDPTIIQKRKIALYRNTLLYLTLRDEHAILWIDSDIIKIPSSNLQSMVDSGKDIITARINMYDTNPINEYDLTTWLGDRVKPSQAELENLKAGGTFIPTSIKGSVMYLQNYATWIDQFVHVDSVSSAFLYVNAKVHRSGINFPTMYVVGTDWNSMEGYDGIGNEGLCYMAKSLGFKCWGMPLKGSVVLHGRSA